MLSSEHRAASASAPVYLELVATNAEKIHLEVVAELQDGKQGAASRSSCSSFWPKARRSHERSCTIH